MSPKVKKIIETINKMGVMSEDIRSVYKDMVDEMVDDLSEEELDELSKNTLHSYASKRIKQSVGHAKKSARAGQSGDKEAQKREHDKAVKRAKQGDRGHAKAYAKK